MTKKPLNVLTVHQAAERLKAANVTIRVWCQRGRFPNAYQEDTVRGPVWLIPESDLEGVEIGGRGRPPKAKPAQPSTNSKKRGKVNGTR